MWGNGPLVVVGCLTKEKELRSYFNLAKRLGRKVVLIAASGVMFPWNEAANPIVQFPRNGNGVPIKVAKRMDWNFEYTDGKEPWEVGVLVGDEHRLYNNHYSRERVANELVKEFNDLWNPHTDA